MTSYHKDTVRDYYIYRILKTGPDEWVDNINTPQKETLDDIVLKSFKDCIAIFITDNLEKIRQNGNGVIFIRLLLNIRWDLLRFLTGYSGSIQIHTVLEEVIILYVHILILNGFKVNHGASERHIFNTANWDESFTVIPTGASGIPASEFYLSQTKHILKGSFIKMLFQKRQLRLLRNIRWCLKRENKRRSKKLRLVKVVR